MTLIISSGHTHNILDKHTNCIGNAVTVHKVGQEVKQLGLVMLVLCHITIIMSVNWVIQCTCIEDCYVERFNSTEVKCKPTFWLILFSNLMVNSSILKGTIFCL